MSMTYTLTDNLDEICARARELCQNGPIHNLLLSYEFPIGLSDMPFNNVHLEKARAWQNAIKPDFLQFNHGQFIHRAGDGVKHIVDELVGRPDSNRALCSLISMADVMGTGDSPIPSFLVTQYGIRSGVLYCTTYFRALEVVKFLPINISELCLIIQAIRNAIHTLVTVRMCIHAFHAYARSDFDCLEKATLDQQGQGLVAAAVFQNKRDDIRSWLSSKLRESSVIDTSGLTELVNALAVDAHEVYEHFPAGFRKAVAAALAELHKLRQLRMVSSHSSQVEESTGRFRALLQEAISQL